MKSGLNPNVPRGTAQLAGHTEQLYAINEKDKFRKFGGASVTKAFILQLKSPGGQPAYVDTTYFAATA